MVKRQQEWQRFTVIATLGRGQFGRTLLVEDGRRNGQQVVIKVPHDEETEEALVNELIVSAALSANLKGITHPNIVRFLGHAKFEGYHVMIMEYIKGRDLRKIVGPPAITRRPMDLKDAAPLFEHMSKGLVAAHAVNLIHRDIKPENTLIRDEDGVAKLTDFGISTILQSASLASMGGTVAGTILYMAPEAFLGRYGFESDIWSLAVTFYEMATGRVPFIAENPFELKARIERSDPVAPSKLNPHVDGNLEGVLMKGLEKDPSRRFRTAQELLDALAPDIDQHVTSARALFNDGREEEAERSLRQLLKRQPAAAKAYLALAEFFNRRQQYAKSEEIVRVGVRQCPDHAGLYLYLAPALWNQGGDKRAEALGALERALQLGLAGAQEQQARILLKKWRATVGDDVAELETLKRQTPPN
jgi:serine/threonine-protein kinase